MKDDKQLATLTTNHNYFMRSAVVEVGKQIIGLLVTWFVIVVCCVFIELAAPSTSSSLYGSYSSGNDVIVAFCGLIVLIAVIGYVVFLISGVRKLMRLHKTVTKIENKVLGDETAAIQD